MELKASQHIRIPLLKVSVFLFSYIKSIGDENRRFELSLAKGSAPSVFIAYLHFWVSPCQGKRGFALRLHHFAIVSDSLRPHGTRHTGRISRLRSTAFALVLLILKKQKPSRRARTLAASATRFGSSRPELWHTRTAHLRATSHFIVLTHGMQVRAILVRGSDGS